MRKQLIIGVCLVITLIFGGVFYYKQSIEKEKEMVVNKFISRYDEINSTTPYEMEISIVKQYSDKNSPLSLLTPEMVNRQRLITYKSHYENNLNLCVDILKYKLYKTKINTIQDVMRIVISDIKKNPNDKLNSIVLKSIDKAIEYNSEYVKRLPDDEFYSMFN